MKKDEVYKPKKGGFKLTENKGIKVYGSEKKAKKGNKKNA